MAAHLATLDTNFSADNIKRVSTWFAAQRVRKKAVQSPAVSFAATPTAAGSFSPNLPRATIVDEIRGAAPTASVPSVLPPFGTLDVSGLNAKLLQELGAS